MATDADELEALPPGTRARSGVVIGIAAFLLGTIVWLLSGGGSEFFHPKELFRSYMSDGAGLEKGAPVRLNGTKVGHVTGVDVSHSMDPNRVIKVEMKIETRYLRYIPADSIAALTADNILGDHYLNISAGKSAELLKPGDEIASLVTNGQFNPADLVASLQLTLTRIVAILDEIDRGDSPVAKFVKEEGFYNNARNQVASLQKFVVQSTDKNTKVGQMFFDDDAYNQLRQSILNVDRTLEDVQRGEGVAGKLLTDSKLYDNAVEQTKNLGQQIASTHKRLNDDTMYKTLLADVASLNKTVDQLTTGDGQVAKLYQNAQLYDSLDKPSGKSAAFMKDFRQNPRKYLQVRVSGKAKSKPAPAKQP